MHGAGHQHGHRNSYVTSQVLWGCIPKAVFQYLSDDSWAPEHSHKSIILNLAYGATIGAAESRNDIFKGYVMSFSPLSII